MPSYLFPRSILHARGFLASCEIAPAKLVEKETLIWWGDADIAFRAKKRVRFAEALPPRKTVILRGAGHSLWEDAPEEIIASIRTF